MPVNNNNWNKNVNYQRNNDRENSRNNNRTSNIKCNNQSAMDVFKNNVEGTEPEIGCVIGMKYEIWNHWKKGNVWNILGKTM